jgi:large subunit ribosomal protein L29
MLKAKDLHERTLEDLRELEKTLTRDVFHNRFKNFTNRLDDTSSIRKAKKDLARVMTVLTARTVVARPAVKLASDAPTSEEAPKAKAKKAAAPKVEAKSAAAEKPAAKAEKKTKTPAKKSEAK